MMMKAKPAGQGEDLAVEGTLPSLAGAVEWLNSPPLTAAGLSGKVVVVDFWTYSCINCLRAIPYVRAWAEKYKAQGLVVIGVHAPEFAFEKNIDNVRKAVSDLKIGYPVAVDNNYAIWRAFKNQYWPAHYFIDAKGQIRHHHFGEGGYDESERVIQQLLTEAGTPAVSTEPGVGERGGRGGGAGPDRGAIAGDLPRLRAGGAFRLARRRRSRQPSRLRDGGAAAQRMGPRRRLDDRRRAGGTQHARRSNRVSIPRPRSASGPGPAPDGKPVRFRVTIDGATPGKGHGTDVDADGQGVVTRQRLYQLIRQSGQITDHTFEIRFLDPGVHAYAFTFG